MAQAPASLAPRETYVTNLLRREGTLPRKASTGSPLLDRVLRGAARIETEEDVEKLVGEIAELPAPQRRQAKKKLERHLRGISSVVARI